LSEGDYVYFEEIEGMKELNYDGVEGSPTSAIKVLGVRGTFLQTFFCAEDTN